MKKTGSAFVVRRRNSYSEKFKSGWSIRSNMVNILQVVILSVCISVPVLIAVAWIVMGKSMDGK